MEELNRKSLQQDMDGEEISDFWRYIRRDEEETRQHNTTNCGVRCLDSARIITLDVIVDFDLMGSK